MKKILFAAIMALPVISAGQHLKTSVDKITKDTLRQTAYEGLYGGARGKAYFRISKINQQEYIDLKVMMHGKAFTIFQGQKILFMLTDGQTVTFENAGNSVAYQGRGAAKYYGRGGYGTELRLPVTGDQHRMLLASDIERVRIYTGDGFFEKELKDGQTSIVKRCLKLL